MMEKARALLLRHYGYHNFRPGQEKIMGAILKGRDTLGIMPTGGGKSVCYQIPALIFPGTTLIISPLISLMKDQVDALNDLGIPATYINSSLPNREVDARLEEAARGTYKMLYVAPERLDNQSFQTLLETVQVPFVAVDEAHCISQWGHDFRPSYRNIAGFLAGFPSRPLVAAFTATATPEVTSDITRYLALQKPLIHINSFDRPNLTFIVEQGQNKIKYLIDYLTRNRGQCGIVYAATRRAVDSLQEILQMKGIAAGKYHAGLRDVERNQAQEAFINDDIQVMVATNAFGMGIDKSNVRFVLHYNMPGHLEAYYQEAGRAGRDGEPSQCILLYNPQDTQIQKFLIEQSRSNPKRKEQDYRKLQAMVDYCLGSGCLRRYILTYFGEPNVPDQCHNCSGCDTDFQLEDITTQAQKIFSCIWRMDERFGTTLVAEVLKGSRNKKVLQQGFQRLSTYGLLANYTVDEIRSMINLLVADGYLHMTDSKYPVLKLGKKSHPVLKGQAAVSRKVHQKVVQQGDDQLFERLRQLRKDLARQAQLPPYMVFPDSTLKEMSRRRPTDRQSMRTITGIGEVKLNRYGEQFIQEISRYLQEHKTAAQNNDS